MTGSPARSLIRDLPAIKRRTGARLIREAQDTRMLAERARSEARAEPEPSKPSHADHEAGFRSSVS